MSVTYNICLFYAQLIIINTQQPKEDFNSQSELDYRSSIKISSYLIENIYYGNHCLIQFEDFGNHNAFRLLERYQDNYCTFNDDIQGTAAVAVAGLLAAGRVTQRKITDDTYLFVGAGEAATGIAQLLATSLQLNGLDEHEAYNKIYMFDKDGLLTLSREEGSLTDHNKVFARDDVEHIRVLEDAVKTLKPTAIIGASGQGGIFTDNILRQMRKNSERPVIFSLSNPTSKSECTAERAYKVTEVSYSFFFLVFLDIICIPITPILLDQ
ncbi:unnamed protein product [Trichobilharzia regenti]|nr:unnamed protein product [Trichobilharzia regenti]